MELPFASRNDLEQLMDVSLSVSFSLVKWKSLFFSLAHQGSRLVQVKHLLEFNKHLVLRAVKELVWKSVAIVGQGADRMVRRELRQQGSPVIGSTAFRPEQYGEKLLELAFKLLRGEAVPPAVYTECTFINAANVNVYYPGEN